MMIIDTLVTNFQSNPLLQTFVGVSGAGLFTFFIRDVVLKSFNLVKRELVTELTITSQHQTYHNLLQWIEDTNTAMNFRKLKATNGMWGHDDATILSIGIGMHLIRYKNKYLLINLQKEPGNQTQYDKETVTLTALGRSNDVFKELIKDLEDVDKDKSKVELYHFTGGWAFVRRLHKRDLDTVFLPPDTKELLIHALEKFRNSEDYYLKHGIPYQLGILLYGSPGTGKSSLIKAIASYLDYPIYYLATTKLSSIQDAARNLPSKCLLVVEDIDTNAMTHGREESEDDEDEEKDLQADVMKKIYQFSLSDVLNSLDGLLAPHGRILLATTNHIENLDPALIRPGRIDYKINIDYITKDTLKTFLDTFYKKDVDLSAITIKPNLTIASLQQMVLAGASIEEVLDYSWLRS